MRNVPCVPLIDRVNSCCAATFINAGVAFFWSVFDVLVVVACERSNLVISLGRIKKKRIGTRAPQTICSMLIHHISLHNTLNLVLRPRAMPRTRLISIKLTYSIFRRISCLFFSSSYIFVRFGVVNKRNRH